MNKCTVHEGYPTKKELKTGAKKCKLCKKRLEYSKKLAESFKETMNIIYKTRHNFIADDVLKEKANKFVNKYFPVKEEK